MIAFLLVGIACGSSVLFSASADTHRFNLPADDAEVSLRRFAEQSGQEIIYPSASVRGITTNAVVGQFTELEAIERMLAGTDLVAMRAKSGAIAVNRSIQPASPYIKETHSPPITPAMSSHKTTRFGQLIALLSALGSSLLSGQSANNATDTSGEIVQLPQFEVKGTAVDPYRPPEMTLFRVVGSIADSPFSVNVATKEFLADIGAGTAFDATRYFAGVSPGRSGGTAGQQDRQNFRGFESFSRTIDSFSTFLIPTSAGFQANFDAAFIERTEVVMGPDSILSPTGTPGGSENLITKSPKFKQSSEITAQVGNYVAQKFTIDTTGPIGGSKHWAYRVIAAIQDTPTFVPGHLKQNNASVQLEYAFSPSTKVDFKWFGLKWQLNGNAANPNNNGEIIYTPDSVGGATLSNAPQPGELYNGWNGSASWTHRSDTVQIIETEFTSALSNHVNMRLSAQVLWDNQLYPEGTIPKGAPAETFDNVTGQVIGVASFDPTAVPILAYHQAGVNREIQFQNDYAGQFNPGSVSLQPVIGLSYQQGSQTEFYNVQNTNMPLANMATSYDPAVPPVSSYTTFSNDSPERAKLFQLYGLMRAGFFNDRIFLTAGASRMWATVDDYLISGVYRPDAGQVGAAPDSPNYVKHFTFNNTGVVIAPTQNEYKDTYLFGVLVKPLKTISLYGSYSSNAGIAGNNPVWQAGTQYEFGLKSEFFHQRLQVSASHFQIIQSNVSTNNPLFILGQSPIQTLLSNQTNHGLEFTLLGGITPDLSAIASYTEMKLRDAFGRRIRNVPDRMANLLLNYRFKSGGLRNFNIYAGVSYVGNVAGETQSGFTPLGVPKQPGFYVAAWKVVNAGAGYKWDRYNFNLNVDNVLNSKFWWQPSSRASVSPYQGITFRFTAGLKF